MTIDIFPTIAGIVGARLPDHTIDGKDIWPLMSGSPGAKSPHEALFFYYAGNELQAMRSGRWKLLFPHRYRSLGGRPGGVGGKPVGYETRECGLELYDLSAENSEQTDVAAQHPEQVERMQEMAEEIRKELGDDLKGMRGTGTRPPGRVES
jgi:arylsulfatase A-like enzyme